MRDPHVQSLRYRVIPPDGIIFDNPPPVQWNTDDFHLTLLDDIATLEMQTHYPSEEDARQGVETYLHRWEMKTTLRLGTSGFHFEFRSAEIIDRDPPPPGSPQIIHVPVAVVYVSALPPTISVTSRKYPDPPVDFAVSPDVESMWNRYQRYVDGRERLTEMAYFCLTVVETSTREKKGARRAASKRYSIEEDLLKKLGHLSSEVGNVETARKMPRRPRDHTGQEIAWIEAAVKALIRRMGEYAYDPTHTWPQVTMKDQDLPPLS
jgi:hypothetical protein